MLLATIIVQFIKIRDKHSNYTCEVCNIFDDIIQYFLNKCYIVAIKQSQFIIIVLLILSD